MSFPSKQDREKCWSSRDVLWKCMDDNGDKIDICSEFRKIYESTCPSQWVKHFDRKREYLKFKDRIQNEGSNSPRTFLHSGDGNNVVPPESSVRIFRKFQPPTFPKDSFLQVPKN